MRSINFLLTYLPLIQEHTITSRRVTICPTVLSGYASKWTFRTRRAIPTASVVNWSCICYCLNRLICIWCLLLSLTNTMQHNNIALQYSNAEKLYKEKPNLCFYVWQITSLHDMCNTG